MTSAAGSESEVAVAGPFEASVRVGREEIRGGPADFSLDVLRRCAPVRRHRAGDVERSCWRHSLATCRRRCRPADDALVATCRRRVLGQCFA
jgi:hypothetical protein